VPANAAKRVIYTTLRGGSSFGIVGRSPGVSEGEMELLASGATCWFPELDGTNWAFASLLLPGDRRLLCREKWGSLPDAQGRPVAYKDRLLVPEAVFLDSALSPFDFFDVLGTERQFDVEESLPELTLPEMRVGEERLLSLRAGSMLSEFVEAGCLTWPCEPESLAALRELSMALPIVLRHHLSFMTHAKPGQKTEVSPRLVLAAGGTRAATPFSGQPSEVRWLVEQSDPTLLAHWAAMVDQSLRRKGGQASWEMARGVALQHARHLQAAGNREAWRTLSDVARKAEFTLPAVEVERLSGALSPADLKSLLDSSWGHSSQLGRQSAVLGAPRSAEPASRHATVWSRLVDAFSEPEGARTDATPKTQRGVRSVLPEVESPAAASVLLAKVLLACPPATIVDVLAAEISEPGWVSVAVGALAQRVEDLDPEVRARAFQAMVRPSNVSRSLVEKEARFWQERDGSDRLGRVGEALVCAATGGLTETGGAIRKLWRWALEGVCDDAATMARDGLLWLFANVPGTAVPEESFPIRPASDDRREGSDRLRWLVLRRLRAPDAWVGLGAADLWGVMPWLSRHGRSADSFWRRCRLEALARLVPKDTSLCEEFERAFAEAAENGQPLGPGVLDALAGSDLLASARPALRDALAVHIAREYDCGDLAPDRAQELLVAVLGASRHSSEDDSAPSVAVVVSDGGRAPGAFKRTTYDLVRSLHSRGELSWDSWLRLLGVVVRGLERLEREKVLRDELRVTAVALQAIRSGCDVVEPRKRRIAASALLAEAQTRLGLPGAVAQAIRTVLPRPSLFGFRSGWR
jgi:hypothetical protein